MTDLEAVNRALTLIAVQPVASLSDSNKAARTLSGLLPGTKRVVLGEFPWSFATRIEPLVPFGVSAPSGYAKSFDYPADCLAVRRLYGRTDFRGVAEFRVLSSSGIQFIAANIEAGSVEYTAFIEDISLWPIGIAECLVTRLASDAAFSLSGSPQMSQMLLEKYFALSRSASQTSVVEENVPPARASDYIEVRHR